jgi:tetratricopeptide (TPR) repeat protein
MHTGLRVGALACVAALMAPLSWAAGAPVASGPPPMPEDLRGYFEQAFAAEKIEDPVARCRAYPDLPGNAWPANAGPGRCILQQTALHLADLEKLLDGPGGAAALDARMKALLKAHYDDPEQRYVMYNTFGQVYAEDAGGRFATRWLRAAPDSAFAQFAMANYRAAQGWDARGSEYMADTSEAQTRRMRQHFLAAVPLLARALETEPTLSPACVTLAAIGRQSSDALQQAVLPRCLERDPASYYVVNELVVASKPKWGGSMQALAATAAYIREHGARNPELYVLLGEVLGYGRTERETYAENREVYEEVARVAPDAVKLEGAARAQADGDRWRALAYLSQAMRFQPRNAKTRRTRAYWWIGLWQSAWAEVDYAWLANAGQANAGELHNLGLVLLEQERPAEAVAPLRAALAMPDAFEGTRVELCRAVVYAASSLDGQEMRDCTAQLVAEEPGNPRYWWLRMQALGFLEDRAGVQEALSRYRKVADLDDPEQVAMLRYTAAWLKRMAE